MQRAAYTVCAAPVSAPIIGGSGPTSANTTKTTIFTSIPETLPQKVLRIFLRSSFHLTTLLKEAYLAFYSYRQTSIVSMVNDVDAEYDDHYDGEGCQVLSSMMIYSMI